MNIINKIPIKKFLKKNTDEEDNNGNYININAVLNKKKHNANIIDKDINEYVILIRTILMLDEHDSNFFMNCFNVKLLQTLTQDLLSRLLVLIRNQITGYANNKYLLELFKYRVDWLEENTKTLPPLKWKMPNAKLPDKYKKIEEFLKSDTKDTVINEAFDSPDEGTLFIRTFGNAYHSIKNGYSARMFNEQGRSINLTIFKTREYHESTIKYLLEFKKELEMIKKLNLKI
jgi:hypothetical protein